MNLKNKVALTLTAGWLIFFGFIMYTQIISESEPAKYLFRTFLMAVSVPIFFLWLTDTLKHVIAWFKD